MLLETIREGTGPTAEPAKEHGLGSVLLEVLLLLFHLPFVAATNYIVGGSPFNCLQLYFLLPRLPLFSSPSGFVSISDFIIRPFASVCHPPIMNFYTLQTGDLRSLWEVMVIVEWGSCIQLFSTPRTLCGRFYFPSIPLNWSEWEIQWVVEKGNANYTAEFN